MTNGLVHRGDYLFHITHIKNLPAILKRGILCKNRLANERIGYENVAYDDIQEVRSRKCIPGTAHTIHDCVPLFFGARPPMLLALKRKGYLSEEIIYIVVKWEIINQPTTWFTDGNARSNETVFYQGAENTDRVDFDAADAWYWGDKGDDFKRKKQAEVLKLDCIALNDIVGFIVYNVGIKAVVENILAAQQIIGKDVVVAEGFYYQ